MVDWEVDERADQSPDAEIAKSDVPGAGGMSRPCDKDRDGRAGSSGITR